MTRTSLLLATISATALLAATSSANAGAFAIKERSTRAQGLSFAGASAGSGGLSSLGFNPAALGFVGDIDLAGGLSIIQPIADGSVRVGGVATGETVEAGRLAGLANGYVGYRIEEDIIIGLGLYTPFGLTTQYPGAWTGTGDGVTSKLLTLAFSPTVAYQPTPDLTFAASLDILYADARLTSGGAGGTNLEGDAYSLSFSAGVIWEPTDTTTVGLAYKHGYNLTLSGTATGPSTGGFIFPAEARTQVPSTISFGVTQAITPEFRVMGEVQWQNWSVFDKIDVTILSVMGTVNRTDPQNYDDAFFVALGGEYDITPDLTVRAGAAWDQTPTSSGIVPGTPAALGITNRTVRVPDEDRIWLSIGASYDMTEHMTIDAAYSYLFAIEDAVVGLRTVPGTSVVYDGGAHIFSVGGSVAF